MANKSKKAKQGGIIAIGASAGGLEALQRVVANLAPEFPWSYVVAQHLSPTHTSMLRALMARETRLKVDELEDGQAPAPGVIYITPPNADVEFREGRLRLMKPQHAVGPKPSVDRLLLSLAEHLGENAIGIILSGTGADGAKGLSALRRAGGLAIVQNPKTAKYSGMPNAALHSGGADYLVAPEEVGGLLSAYLRDEAYHVVGGDEVSVDHELLDIIRVVYEQAGLDLSGYKTSTLRRRIQRRMGFVQIRTLDDYAEFLLKNDDEASAFAREVLVSVTEFFRDKQAFEALGKVVEKMLASAGSDREIRIWNVGCATGEEAYSIAVLFEEALRKHDSAVRYKIFATDIDAKAIAVARRGEYPDSAFEQIPREWRDHYFEANGDTWLAEKRLRNNIVFSVHNLVQDPPFSRIDLISCRNLLIYFNNAQQKRVLEFFHYALNSGGLLFLGRSESIELHKDLFVNVNKDARIFRKQQVLTGARPFQLHPDGGNNRLLGSSPAPHRKPDSEPLPVRINQFTVEHYAPPLVAINALDEIAYVVGDVSPYLGIRSGPLALNLFSMINDQFRTEVRALVYKCRREKQSITGSRYSVLTPAGEQQIRIVLHPMPMDRSGQDAELLMIVFERILEQLPAQNAPAASRGDEDPRLKDLEHQLSATQEHLQTVIEELETSNEELQSLTEELQSSNEELQSTNEELQTSNEELQSTNEELLTVNEEFQVKSQELEIALNDLQNILESSEYPLLVVNRELRVTRYVPAAQQTIVKGAIHCGDNISALSWRLELTDLRGIVEKVMATGESYQEIVKCGSRYYRFVANPYRLGDQGIAGVVLWFPDVTDLTLAHEQMIKNKEYLRAVFGSVLLGIITIDGRGVIQGANHTAEHMFGYSAEELVGKRINSLMPAEHAQRHDDYLAHYHQTGEKKIIGTIRELVAMRKDGSTFPIELSVNELKLGGETVFCGAISDISKRKQAETDLHAEQRRALVTLESINDAVISVDSDQCIQYMNPVAEKLTGWSNKTARGTFLCEIYKVVEETSRLALDNRLVQALQEGERITFQDGIILRASNGKEFSIEHSVAPITGDQGEITGGVLTFHDVTNKRLLLQQITWQAQHDPLTGLVNRKEFEHRIENALASAKSFARQHALLYLDLDQFKLVNDTCGHHAGDQLLRQLGSLLGAAIRKRDTLARMGGDEFAVLLENCSLSQAERIAEKLHDLVQGFRFAHDEKIFKIGVSIGVVMITHETDNPASLFSDADAACYAAKENGRNRIQLHSPDDKELEYKRREMHWVTRLNLAIDENRFQLYFQPIMDLSDGIHQRWEVLLRLVDENNELVLPGVFLPAAERYGLIQSLDRWVLACVLIELKKFPAATRPVLSINLSGSSIVNTKFFEYAVDLIKQNLDLAECICFEITETTAITNFSAAQKFMRSMTRLGCWFALDDFGSGMSSFGYLKNLPVDYLKIDGVFVKDMLHDQIDLFMVESINRIGQIMNIKTIAEFAENKSIIDKLGQIGVDYAQGYGVGRPIPLDEFLCKVGAAGTAQT